MSHFFAIALLREKELDNAESRIEEMMDRYSEHLEVSPYEHNCWCIGSKAREDARKAASKLVTVKDFGVLKKLYWKLVTEKKLKDNNTNWKKFIKTYTDEEERVLKDHPKKNEPNPKCEECYGEGVEMITYNPDSKWDWYVIGGRWNGTIRQKQRDDKDGGFNFGDEFHKLDENFAKVADLLKTKEAPFPTQSICSAPLFHEILHHICMYIILHGHFRKKLDESFSILLPFLLYHILTK